MDRHTRDIVTAIATDVRHWAEEQAYWGEKDNLTGWCAKASAELWRRLKKVGIASEIHQWTLEEDGSSHVYVVVEDHVVDVTASQFKQFKNTRLVIMHCREAEVYAFYQTREIFKCVDFFRKKQKKDRWPQDQIALPA